MRQKATLAVALMPQSQSAIPSAVSTHSQPRIGPSRNLSPIRTIRLYLTTLSPIALDVEAAHNELAMRAKIILEYMVQHSINDISHGIRAFTAFERDRLHRLGMIVTKKRGALQLG